MSEDEFKQKGNDCFSKKDFEGAIKWFSEAINVNPNNHVFYSNRSASYASLKQYEEALKDAKKTVELKSDWARGYSRLGAAHVGLHQYEEACEAYTKGLELEPGNAQMKQALEEAKSEMMAGQPDL